MVFWSFTPSFCHVMVLSLCSSTTAQNSGKTIHFATWPLEQVTPSQWLWVPHSWSFSIFMNCHPHLYTYTFFVCIYQACTGGGCTLSPPSQAQTEESTPENVPAPLVTPLSPHELNVSWTPPDTPNGEWIRWRIQLFLVQESDEWEMKHVEEKKH